VSEISWKNFTEFFDEGLEQDAVTAFVLSGPGIGGLDVGLTAGEVAAMGIDPDEPIEVFSESEGGDDPTDHVVQVGLAEGVVEWARYDVRCAQGEKAERLWASLEEALTARHGAVTRKKKNKKGWQVERGSVVLRRGTSGPYPLENQVIVELHSAPVEQVL
jgi:hypothetical protein